MMSYGSRKYVNPPPPPPRARMRIYIVYRSRLLEFGKVGKGMGAAKKKCLQTTSSKLKVQDDRFSAIPAKKITAYNSAGKMHEKNLFVNFFTTCP